MTTALVADTAKGQKLGSVSLGKATTQKTLSPPSTMMEMKCYPEKGSAVTKTAFPLAT